MSQFFSTLANIAGVLGLALSTFLLVRDVFRERERYSIAIIDYDVHLHSARFYVCFTNHSHRALVITGITYLGTLCELDPKRIRQPPEPLPLQHTPQFPVAIEALGARMCYIEFLNPSQKQLSPGMPVTFQIQTTSRSVSKTVFLGDKSHYLYNDRSSRFPR